MVITVRHGHKVYHPATGVEIVDQELKPLRAEFGIHGGEYTTIDPETGEERIQADIRGYFYDLDADAAAKGWSDDEKEAVRGYLIRKAETNPNYVQIYETPKASKPWPTYDEVHHAKVASLAIDLGLVEPALYYEQENKNRQTIVAELRKALFANAEEELTAA